MPAAETGVQLYLKEDKTLKGIERNPNRDAWKGRLVPCQRVPLFDIGTYTSTDAGFDFSFAIIL
jgi:hypothetical protein